MIEPIVTPEMREQIAVIRNQYRKKKRHIAELKVNVTGPLNGAIDNWPSHIQDGIYEALDKTQLGRKYSIKISYCDQTPEDGWYIHVIATAETTVQ